MPATSVMPLNIEKLFSVLSVLSISLDIFQSIVIEEYAKTVDVEFFLIEYLFSLRSQNLADATQFFNMAVGDFVCEKFGRQYDGMNMNKN